MRLLTFSVQVLFAHLIAVLALSGCGGGSSSPPVDAGASDATRPPSSPVVIFSSGVKQLNQTLTDTTVVMTDGRVLVVSADAPPRVLSVPPASEMREHTVLTKAGDVFNLWPQSPSGAGLSLSNATRVNEPGPLTLFRNGWVRKPDGGVLILSPDSDEVYESLAFRGATQCDMFDPVCIFDGIAKGADGLAIDIGGPAIDVCRTLHPLSPGIDGSGLVLLRADGAVFARQARASDETAARLPIRLDLGLPPIARVYQGFFEDSRARIWYVGLGGRNWPEGLLSKDVPRFGCTIAGEGKSPNVDAECVRATEIPALSGTTPSYVASNVLALSPDGKLTCWPFEGRACPRGE